MALPRTLEPEVMDAAAEAADYDRMDHAAVNRAFAADFLAAWPVRDGTVLDVGTGTAQIPVELCRQADGFDVWADDASANMLQLAERNVLAAGVGNRVFTHLGDAKRLPHTDDFFLAVVSNSLIHHIPDPAGVFADLVRVCHPGGTLFVRDLLRPETADEVERLVGLHAALTVAEVRELVAALGFAPDTVTQTSDRHWTWSARKPA